jgi:phage/plasmid primase-like uncharacterized protein
MRGKGRAVTKIPPPSHAPRINGAAALQAFENDFRNAAAAAGVDLPSKLRLDGRPQRYKAHAKDDKRSMSFIGHADGVPNASVYDMRKDSSKPVFTFKGRAPDGMDAAAIAKEAAASKAKREADDAERQANAAAEAERLSATLPLADPNHPYLKAKGIEPPDGIRQQGNELFIPIERDGKPVGGEFIGPDSSKRVLTGTDKAGGCFLFGAIAKGRVLYIAESFSTGATIHKATGCPVLATFGAGNLLAVAKAHEGAPCEIVISSDDDWTKPGNPGRTYAREAAIAIGAKLAMPDFSGCADREDGDTDFNDLARIRGLDAVRECLDRAERVEQMPGVKDDAQESREWPEPGEIEAPLHPVDKFDAEALLPESVRPYVVDASWRMPCAVDYIAASLIVAAGAVIGARAGIKPKRRDDWVVVPNLWGGVVGDPSQKKSPAISEGMKPLGKLIARAIAEHEKATGEQSIVKLIRDAQKENIEGKLKKAVKGGKNGDLTALTKELKEFIKTDDPEPILRRYRTNDATVEKLGEMLRDNPNGLLALRDELVGLLASWDKSGHENDRQFFLESWNGTDSFDTDRIGRGSILIPNLCLSVFGGIQPDKLTGYLEQASNALANDGMLQRFQVLVYPDPVKWEWRDAIPDKVARELVNDVFEKLDDFDPVEWGADPANEFVKFPYFRFDDEAQETYIRFSGELHRSIERESNPLIKQHLAKYEKLFPALALVLHLMDCAASGKQGPVTKAAAVSAAAWCQYLETHARRCYGLIADEGLRAAQALAKHLSSGNLPKGFDLGSFTARDVRRNQWRYLTTDELIKAALDWLEDEGWIRQKPGARKSGRPTVRYELNPRVRGA